MTIKYPGAGGRTRRVPPPKIGKKYDFVRKIVIFHTKYPKIFAPRSARPDYFKHPPPNLKSWIRPWYLLRGVGTSTIRNGCDQQHYNARDLDQ